MLGVDSVGPTTPTSDLLADRYDLRRSLKTGNGVETYFAIDTTTGESVEYAFAHPEASRDYVRAHAQELSDDVCRQHIELYVNEFSVDLGAEGLAAIAALIAEPAASRATAVRRRCRR